jgi:CelD/BcsL family acetyltransferase involved in cellulose biosynthesis
MSVEIRVANNADAQEWDRIISESPHGTLFHHWNWLKITEKHTRSTLYPLICLKNGVPVGVFPLFFQKKGPVRMVFSPPPHAALFYLGPVLVEPDSLRQEKREEIYFDFQNSVENFILNKLKANYISISLSPTLQDPRPFDWSGYSVDPLYDYEIDLTKGTEYLFRTIDKKQRQDLTRAKKKGITVEVGLKNEFEKILDLMEIRYAQQQKVVTVPRSYLADIFNSYKDNITVFVAKYEEEIVTGLIDLHYKDTIYSWIGNLKPIVKISPSPTDLLNWEAVSYGCEQGFRYYVLLSAAGNERLHSYSSAKFNPELKIRYHAKKTSAVTGFFERGYISILKPLRGRMKQLTTEE